MILMLESVGRVSGPDCYWGSRLPHKPVRTIQWDIIVIVRETVGLESRNAKAVGALPNGPLSWQMEHGALLVIVVVHFSAQLLKLISIKVEPF